MDEGCAESSGTNARAELDKGWAGEQLRGRKTLEYTGWPERGAGGWTGRGNRDDAFPPWLQGRTRRSPGGGFAVQEFVSWGARPFREGPYQLLWCKQ